MRFQLHSRRPGMTGARPRGRRRVEHDLLRQEEPVQLERPVRDHDEHDGERPEDEEGGGESLGSAGWHHVGSGDGDAGRGNSIVARRRGKLRFGMTFFAVDRRRSSAGPPRGPRARHSGRQLVPPELRAGRPRRVPRWASPRRAVLRSRPRQRSLDPPAAHAATRRGVRGDRPRARHFGGGRGGRLRRFRRQPQRGPGVVDVPGLRAPRGSACSTVGWAGGSRRGVRSNRARRAAAPAGDFRAALQPGQVRTLDEVRAILDSGSAQVVDARPAGRFRGVDPEPRAGLRGRAHARRAEPPLRRPRGRDGTDAHAGRPPGAAAGRRHRAGAPGGGDLRLGHLLVRRSARARGARRARRARCTTARGPSGAARDDVPVASE